MKQTIPNQLRKQIISIFWITIAWTLISVYRFLLGFFSLKEFGCDLPTVDPMLFFEGSIITGIMAGILGGSFLVFLWGKWLRSKKYGAAMLYMLLSYSAIYIFISVAMGLIFLFKHPEIVTTQSTEEGKNLFSIAGELHNYLFWFMVVLITLIIFQVSDKYGPGGFRSFLLGKYFQPKREERIFMFLDLRSSTTIAEHLGEVKYFNFLREVFQDATPAILRSRGEIYQYVGDEIVISWKMNRGIENANCLHCFFNVQNTLRERMSHYNKKYDGNQPIFKAGLHYGYVMTGEIGVVKRDIAFSGDVLNTTARIQSKCNELGVDILLSKYLLDKLRLKTKMFNPKKIGNLLLRGKEQKVMLYTV